VVFLLLRPLLLALLPMAQNNSSQNIPQGLV